MFIVTINVESIKTDIYFNSYCKFVCCYNKQINMIETTFPSSTATETGVLSAKGLFILRSVNPCNGSLEATAGPRRRAAY